MNGLDVMLQYVPLTIDGLDARLQCLRIKNGDLLILKSDHLTPTQMVEFRRALFAALPKDMTIMGCACLKPGDTLQSLDEEQMRKAGWVRAPKNESATIAP